MTHVLIVDDEALERQAMKKIISMSIPGVNRIGEASNGNESVYYVKTDAPDLVLMDIKMPGMDGLEAIQTIKKIQPQTRFIMVSAFNTFEYAQQAIREGVKDYLVKPSKKEEIIQTISRVLQEIEVEQAKQKEEEQIQNNYYRAMNQLQTDWVASLLLNHINRESFYLESFSVGDYQSFLALVLQIQSEDVKVSPSTFYEEIAALIQSVSLAAVGPLMNDQLPVLLPFNEEEGESSIQSRATGVARQLLKQIEKQKPEWNCRIGLGSPVKDVHQFSQSYQNAVLALEETNSNVKYMYYHPSILKNRSESKLDEEENILIEMIRSGKVETFDQVFYSYFKELTVFFKQSLVKMMKHLEELRILINRYLKDWKSDLWVPEHAFRAETLVQLRERARSGLIILVQQIHEWHDNQENGMIYKAKDWIDQHFCEAVTLDDAAATVQLSSYYFSKLFKENFGQTFIDYLTQRRIELAKSLLVRTEKTFKEICYEVGYHDPNYFSRVFKKITSTTPSDYRKTNKLGT